MAKQDPNKLSVSWSKREKDFVYRFPRKCDGHLLHNFLNYLEFPESYGMTIRKELANRGYDLTTLKFSIKRKRDVDLRVLHPTIPTDSTDPLASPTSEDSSIDSGSSVRAAIDTASTRE